MAMLTKSFMSPGTQKIFNERCFDPASGQRGLF
jgi:hypothetical protein